MIIEVTQFDEHSLFHEQFFNYYPYVFSGRVIWQLLSGTLIESLNTLINSQGYILNNNLPPLIFIHRIALRNLIIFLHNALFAFILLGFSQSFTPYFFLYWLAIPLGAVFILLALIPYAFILALLGARYRDLNFLMPYCMQILFYATPIVWKTKYFSNKFASIIALNPLNSLVNFLRDLFLGQPICFNTLMAIVIFATIGWFIVILASNLSKERLCYWIL